MAATPPVISYKGKQIQLLPREVYQYLMRVEGDAGVQKAMGKFKDSRFLPYKDPGGGAQVVGYGHTIRLGEAIPTEGATSWKGKPLSAGRTTPFRE